MRSPASPLPRPGVYVALFIAAITGVAAVLEPKYLGYW